MRLPLVLATAACLLAAPACDQATVDRVLQTAGDVAGSGALSQADIGKGLKQALEQGIGKGAQALAQKGGYFDSPYKILLPPEARKVTDKLQGVPGFNNLEAIVLEKINAGAEEAAKEAKPIFVNAIRQMTFADATNILMGADDAATGYLRGKTFGQLEAKFQPIIVRSLDKFDARKVWRDAATAYNRIPLTDDVTTELDQYVTQQALNGLFAMVAREELNIRDNVAARTTDLMRRVFARQD